MKTKTINTPNWNEISVNVVAHAEIYRQEMAGLLSELRLIQRDSARGAVQLINHFDAAESRKIDDPIVDEAVRDIAAAANRALELIERLEGHHP